MPTRSRRSLSRLASNAAVLAVLLHGLLPAFSQALALRDGAAPGWVQVCNTQGQVDTVRPFQLRLPEDEAQTEPPDAPAPWQTAVCRLCLAHATSWAMPPHRPGLAPAVSTTSAPCTRSTAEATPPAWRLAWAVPAVRAPPATS